MHVCNMEHGGIRKSGVDLCKYIWACVWDLALCTDSHNVYFDQGVQYKGFHHILKFQ